MHFLERKLILVPLQFQFFVCFTCIYKRGTGYNFFDTNKVLFENIEAFKQLYRLKYSVSCGEWRCRIPENFHNSTKLCLAYDATPWARSYSYSQIWIFCLFELLHLTSDIMVLNDHGQGNVWYSKSERVVVNGQVVIGFAQVLIWSWSMHRERNWLNRDARFRSFPPSLSV